MVIRIGIPDHFSTPFTLRSRPSCFRTFLMYCHRPFLTILGEMSDIDKGMNLIHFRSHQVEIRISVNPESNPGFFWLRLDALTEVCSFWVLYSFIMKLFTSCYCIIRWSTAVYVNMHCFVRKIISSWKFTEDRETSLSRIGYGQEYGLVSVFSSYCFKLLLCPSPVRYGITLTYAPNFNALLGVQLWFRATWHCTVWE